MAEVELPTASDVLYRDGFGELTAQAGDRLIWRAVPAWWDDNDEARWRKLTALNHPALARVLDYRRESGQLVLEYQRPAGQSLAAIISSANGHPALEALTGLALLVQLASALETLHSLDLYGLTFTPALVFVHRDDTNPAFTLIPVPAPLNMERLHTTDYLRNEQPIEVLPYLAQERLRVRPITSAVDVYALGVVGSQVLCSAQLPRYTDKADLIRACVAGRFQSQIAPRDTVGACDIIRECLARRPGRRLKAAEARAGLAAILSESLCLPCSQAHQQQTGGHVNAALDTLRLAMRDAIRDRNPKLYLFYAELLAQQPAPDPLMMIDAGRSAAERVERLLDEKQLMAPVDRYFTAYLFASPAEVQLTARQIYKFIGNVYRRENLPKKAIEQYDRALQLAGDDGPLLLDYATTLLQADRPGEALRALERAEKIGGADYRMLQLEKAQAMERQGMLDQAIAAYQIVLRIAPDGAIWTQVGKLYLPKGPEFRHKAEHAFRQAIKTDPHQLEAASYLADLALDQNNDEAALAALSSVQLPQDFRGVTPALVAFYLRQVDGLSQHMSARLSERRDDPIIHRMLGDLYLLRARLVDDAVDAQRFDLASEDYLRALLSYEVSLAIDPEQPDLLQKVQAIQEPLVHEQSALEYRLQESDTAIDVYNRLALVDWRLARIAGGHDTPGSRQNAVAHLARAVELLDHSVQQDLSQREVRRLFAVLAEQLRRLQSGD
jgi:tetratricopeptide (TPR) repeat protein